MDTSEKVQDLSLLSPTVTSTELGEFGNNLYRDYLKRFFDLFLAVLSLPITLPVLLLLTLLIKIDSRGPALFKSERLGRDGKKFLILKLRTMCQNADEKLEEILKNNEVLRMEWKRDHKLRKDPRITRVGKALRALSLDELPQILNVFKGEMSFVGPRPIVEAEIYRYGNRFSDYKSVRPGITGIWQINGRNDTSYAKRVAMDTQYANEAYFSLDLKILAKTIPAALSKKGAY